MRYTVAYMVERGITVLVRFPVASNTPGCPYGSGASPDLPPIRSSRFDGRPRDPARFRHENTREIAAARANGGPLDEDFPEETRESGHIHPVEKCPQAAPPGVWLRTSG